MPLHKPPLIMAFNVQENRRFHTRIFKKSPFLPTMGGEHTPSLALPSPPPPPIDKSQLHHCHWHRGHSTLIWTGGGGAKNLNLSQNRSAHKKYNLSQNTLLKLSYACIAVLVRTDFLFCCVSSYIHLKKICCVPRAPSLVPRSRACHKHCGPARTVAGAEIASLS